MPSATPFTAACSARSTLRLSFFAFSTDNLLAELLGSSSIVSCRDPPRRWQFDTVLRVPRLRRLLKRFQSFTIRSFRRRRTSSSFIPFAFFFNFITLHARIVYTMCVRWKKQRICIYKFLTLVSIVTEVSSNTYDTLRYCFFDEYLMARSIESVPYTGTYLQIQFLFHFCSCSRNHSRHLWRGSKVFNTIPLGNWLPTSFFR